MTKSLKPRNVVDVFRVRYWYTGVMHKLKFETAYQVERKIEPDHFRLQDQRTVYPGKWRRYAVGENTPQKKLVLTVDQQAKGSAYELNHPLWLILKKLSSDKFKATSYIRYLNPTIQSVVMRPQTDQLGAPLAWAPYTNLKAKVLLRRGTLDALAALVLYWHDAKTRNDHPQAEAVATSIYHMLLLIGWDMRSRQLHTGLFSLFRAEIFDKTIWEEGCFAVDNDTFEISICLLHNCFDSNSDKERMKASDWRKEMTRIQELLAGDKGFDIRFAMKPFCLPQWNFGPPSRNEVVQWEIHRRHWAWGWDCLLHNRIGKFPENSIDNVDPDDNWALEREEDIYLRINQLHWNPIPESAAIIQYGRITYCQRSSH